MKNILSLRKNKTSILFQNTLALITSSILIKILSMLNRILMTRVLGNYGISLYIYSIPTIMLFTSLGGFSLNISIARITSSKKINPKEIIKKSLKIALISSFVSVLILILFSKIIALKALKQPILNSILLSSSLFIIINAINNVYKGLLTGYNKLKKISLTQLIEQIVRILLIGLLCVINKSNNIIYLVILCIISMTIGELMSLIYNIFCLNRIIKEINIKEMYSMSKNDYNNILTFSFTTTLSHFISNIQLFLEPIIFSFSYSLINISSDTTLYKYSEINAYALPTLTLISFISYQVSSALFPVFSKKYNIDNDYIENKTNKYLYYLLVVGIFSAHVFYYYGENILIFLYNTNIGYISIKLMCYFFIFMYITPILNMLLQISGKEKYLMKLQILISLIKLSLIFIFIITKYFSNYSLVLSIIITSLIYLLLILNKSSKIIKIKIPVLKLVFIFLFTFIFFYIISFLNINFIIAIIISFIITLLLVLFLK